MDPVTGALKQFQREFRRFRADRSARVLLIETDVQNLGAVQQTLRGEEWHPDNRSPFVLFGQPQDAAGECWVALAEQVRLHWTELRAGMEREGTVLPEFAGLRAASSRIDWVVAHLERWVELSAGVLEPPLLCWLPPALDDAVLHGEMLCALIDATAPCRVRFVFADCAESPGLLRTLAATPVPHVRTAFRPPDDDVRGWFRRTMLMEPRRGRARGAPPGAAAPDIDPPARPGPQPPTEVEVRETLHTQGLPPVLSAADGEQLRRLIFSAAARLGDGDVDGALRDQHEAYGLCARARVPLEQSLMALLLAGYLVQANRTTEAATWYWESAQLAYGAKAPAQVAQALMGLGYLHLNARAYEDAARVYRLAAQAASRGNAFLLVIENLRMAGICLRSAGQDTGAIEAWREAVDLGAEQPPGVVSASSLPAVIAELKRVLNERGSTSEYEDVAGTERRILAGARV